MILLIGEAQPAPLAVAVFGAGLIGSAAVAACERLGGLRARRLALSWSDPAAQRRDLAAIEEALLGERAGRLAVLWSAGAAGFAAGEAEAAAELASFRAVLATCRRAAARRPDRPVSFHLVGSAGGLHEGSRLVAPGAEPAPRRPYGRLKLAQERELTEQAPELGRRIYRLSSVFGHLAEGRRRGLIPTLLADGLGQRVSTVTGRPDTLRDFIWAGDVGRYLARELARPDAGPAPAPATLAAGKPSTLLEVQRLIETALRRKLYLTYRPHEAGAADITFAPALLAPGWRPGDLYARVCEVRDRILGCGAGRATPKP